jgi:Xaa-Pro aminopeptidase
MSAPAEKLDWSPETAPAAAPDSTPDRGTDLAAKQAWVASLLRETGCAGLMVVEPENFAWLTSGGTARGVLNPADLPVLFFSPEQRCVVSSNADSQRLFDEELDGLGFQLKEWPWYWGREQLLADLCQGRKAACDRPQGDCLLVNDQLRQRRQALSLYEQACLRSLGQLVGHALEATCRNLVPGQTERETAGQLGHRLFHRGAYPVSISVAADDQARLYRQSGFTSTPIERYCVLTATARKYGLYVTASRTVSFGRLDDRLRQESEAACKVAATYVGATWADAVPQAIFNTARNTYQVSGFEHEWRLCPQGFVTGRVPVELLLLPKMKELLQLGWAITWQASVGAALTSDTYLITSQGPEVITPCEAWPLKRIRFHGADILQPAPLER